ncbi:hypothetical protein BH10BAC2_BH10BAC2_33950 [soil metagenome]
MAQPQKDKYEILILPIDYNKSFLDFDKEEVQKYYQWFLNIKSDRLTHLCNFLFAKSDDCLQEINLNVIEIFLLHSVSTVPKPKEQFDAELEKMPMHLKPYAKPDNYVLDKKTISICYDIGIFLGDLIIKLDPKIKWKLQNSDEYADYGQPILAKKNMKFDVNPFRVAKNVASKIYEGKYTEGQIISFFTAWKKGFKIDE